MVDGGTYGGDLDFILHRKTFLPRPLFHPSRKGRGSDPGEEVGKNESKKSGRVGRGRGEEVLQKGHVRTEDRQSGLF